MISNILDQLRRDEGLRLIPYRDKYNHLTVGYGHNLDAHPQDMSKIQGGMATKEQCEQWLLEDEQLVLEQLRAKIPWVFNLSEVYRGVVNNMTFNMGIADVLKFNTFLELMAKQDFVGAANDLYGTLVARELPERYGRLEEQLRTGQWQ